MTWIYGRKANPNRRTLLAQMGGALAAGNAASSAFFTSAQAQEAPIRMVAFGDSLTAGYQLAPAEAFPQQLQAALRGRGQNINVTNAGVSGDTTSAGRERLAWAVPTDTEAVILALGGNDLLRGLDPAKARDNLDAMITALKAQGAEVLLCGMRAPTSMGDAYIKPFDALYYDLATKHGLLLYPLFIAAYALRPELNLGDGLHPNAKGVAAKVADILPRVEELIARVKARRAQKG